MEMRKDQHEEREKEEEPVEAEEEEFVEVEEEELVEEEEQEFTETSEDSQEGTSARWALDVLESLAMTARSVVMQEKLLVRVMEQMGLVIESGGLAMPEVLRENADGFMELIEKDVTEIDKLMGKVNSVGEFMQELVQENIDMEEAVRVAETIVAGEEELNNKCVQYEKEISGKDRMNKELAEDNRRLRTGKDSTEKELVLERSENAKLRKASERRETEHGYLNKRLNEIKMENEELKLGLDEKSKQVEILRKSIDRSQTETCTIKETLEQDVRDKTELLEMTHREIGSLQRENSALRTEVETWEKRDREEKLEAINRMGQVGKLQNEVERLAGGSRLLRMEVEVKEKESEEYARCLERKTEQVMALDREVESLRVENSNLRKDVEAMEMEAKDKEQGSEGDADQRKLLKEEVESRYQEVDKDETKMGQDKAWKIKICQNLNNLEVENNMLRTEREKLQRELDKYKESEERMKDELQRVEEEHLRICQEAAMQQERNTSLNGNLLLCQEEIVKLRENLKLCEEMVREIRKDSGRTASNDWRKHIADRVVAFNKIRAEREELRKEINTLGHTMETVERAFNEYMLELQDDARYLQGIMKMDGDDRDGDDCDKQDSTPWMAVIKGKQEAGKDVRASKKMSYIGRCKIFGIDEGMDRILICERLVGLGRCRIEEIELGQYLSTGRGTFAAYVTAPLEIIRRVCYYGQFYVGRKRLWIKEVMKENSQCSRCWEFGHWSRECSSDSDISNRCFYCGERGHRIKDCLYKTQRKVGTKKGSDKESIVTEDERKAGVDMRDGNNGHKEGCEGKGTKMKGALEIGLETRRIKVGSPKEDHKGSKVGKDESASSRSVVEETLTPLPKRGKRVMRKRRVLDKESEDGQEVEERQTESGGTEENLDKDAIRQEGKLEEGSVQEVTKWRDIKEKEAESGEETVSSLSHWEGPLDSHMKESVSWKDGSEWDRRPPRSDVSSPGGSARKKGRLL